VNSIVRDSNARANTNGKPPAGWGKRAIENKRLQRLGLTPGCIGRRHVRCFLNRTFQQEALLGRGHHATYCVTADHFIDPRDEEPRATEAELIGSGPVSMDNGLAMDTSAPSIAANRHVLAFMPT